MAAQGQEARSLPMPTSFVYSLSGDNFTDHLLLTGLRCRASQDHRRGSQQQLVLNHVAGAATTGTFHPRHYFLLHRPSALTSPPSPVGYLLFHRLSSSLSSVSLPLAARLSTSSSSSALLDPDARRPLKQATTARKMTRRRATRMERSTGCEILEKEMVMLLGVSEEVGVDGAETGNRARSALRGCERVHSSAHPGGSWSHWRSLPSSRSFCPSKRALQTPPSVGLWTGTVKHSALVAAR